MCGKNKVGHMKIHEIKDKVGRIGAFEVANFGRHRACRFVSKIPGVRIVKRQKHFQFRADAEFCEFELNGKRFVIWEPFGDNSRFWIGPKSTMWCAEVDEVRSAFASYKAFWFF
jgi:hypothetical protein